MAFKLSNITSLLKKDIKAPADRTIIGVDVGSSAIKIVQVHDNKGTATLDTYGELQLGPYGDVEIGRSTNLPLQKLTEAFVDILRESSASSKDVALAISYNSSFSTIVPIPTKNPKEIDAMVPVEARKYIPIPLNEVSLDWFPVSATSDQNSTKVLLAAIHNNSLEKYKSMIKGASLNQQFSEIEIFSAIRSSVEQDDTTAAVIDLGATSTKLYIAERGVVGKTHSLRMNGVELTQALANATGVSFKEAEELKRQVGLFGVESDPSVQATMLSILEKGFREMHIMTSRYRDEEQSEIKKVILTGSGALLKGLDVYVNDMFGVEVVISDPFSKVAYPAFLEDTLKEAGPTFTVAVGAALRALVTG